MGEGHLCDRNAVAKRNVPKHSELEPDCRVPPADARPSGIGGNRSLTGPRGRPEAGCGPCALSATPHVLSAENLSIKPASVAGRDFDMLAIDISQRPLPREYGRLFPSRWVNPP